MNGNGPPAPAVPSPAELRAAIPWVEGHADVWRLFADPTLLTRCVHALALPFKGDGITHVVGIESRGFLLGGAAAVALGAGFVAVRKQPRSHFPGRVLSEVTGPDYKGEVCQLRLQADVLPRRARVLVVDDGLRRAASCERPASCSSERVPGSSAPASSSTKPMPT